MISSKLALNQYVFLFIIGDIALEQASRDM